METLDESWNRLLDSTGLSDRVIFVLGTCISNILLIWGYALMIYLSCKLRLFWKYRIQPDAKIDLDLTWKTIRQLLTSQFFLFPVVGYSFYPIFTYFGTSVRGPIPSINIIVRDVIVSVLLLDCSAYWTHRGLHHPLVYKYVHKKHHEYKVNNVISANHASPVEDLINMIQVFLGPWLLGSHVLVFWLWISIRQLEASSSHAGYQFTHWYFLNSAEFHEFHHSHNIGAYGSFFTIWDYICGTDKAFYEHRAKLSKLE